MTLPAEILFVQRRPTRAGAQTSLFRIAASSSRRTVTLCAEEGWLTANLPETIIARWPSPRSWPARWGGLTRFARKISPRCQGLRLVVANDHQECPVALAIARELGIPCLAILRTPQMSRKDFSKYLCDQCDHLFAVGRELHDKLGPWTTTPHSLFVEGFMPEEFLSFPPGKARFPSTILVVGSEEPRKGFQDFLEALNLLRRDDPGFPLKKVVFTGRPPADLPDSPDGLFEFVGRVADFIPFARQFEFAVHPSRHESFGLAPLELIISGVPTLCTETGCLDQSLLPSSWLVPPSSPRDLARALRDWQKHWPDHRAHLPGVIQRIRESYGIDKTLTPFFETVDRLTALPRPHSSSTKSDPPR